MQTSQMQDKIELSWVEEFPYFLIEQLENDFWSPILSFSLSVVRKAEAINPIFGKKFCAIAEYLV